VNNGIFPKILNKAISSEQQAVETGEELPIVEKLQAQELNPQLTNILAAHTVWKAVNTLGLLLLAIGFLGIAFKQNPDFVYGDDGTSKRMRPLEFDEQKEADRIKSFLEKRLPALFTFSPMMPDEKDPTGRNFVPDPFEHQIILENNDRQTIPTTVYREQYVFADPQRINIMRTIAKLYKQVENEISSQTPVDSVSKLITYRYRRRSAVPMIPKEISHGRWEVIVHADIIRHTPMLELLPEDKRVFKSFKWRVIVSRADKVPRLLNDFNGQDLVAWGHSDGYQIEYLMEHKLSEGVAPPARN
jgi:hypothetical protein